MDDKERRRIQLECLYDMFRDRIEENVIYIVHMENDGKIDITVEQLMAISKCSFTGHHFEAKPLVNTNTFNSIESNNVATKSDLNSTNLHDIKKTTSNSKMLIKDSNENNLDVVQLEDDDFIDDNATIDERIEILQKYIDDLLVEKNTNHDKASYYSSMKKFSITSYYSEEATRLKRMIDRKTSQLVKLLLEKSQDSNCIDLHGLNPIQASLVVSELLKIRQEKLVIDRQGEATLDIITGWGKHSVTQGHYKVKPTIIKLLSQKGIRYHKLNRGALRVTIRRC